MDLPSLASMLQSRNGSKIVSFTAVTSPKLKGGMKAPFSGCTKRSEVNSVLNWIYENAVNARREKEGKESDFEAEPRAWGERVFIQQEGKRILTPFVKHIKDGEKRIYLEAKVTKSNSDYFMGNKPIPYDEIKPYITERNTGRQDLEQPVILADYQTVNLRTITFAGQTHELNITPEQEEEFYDAVSK